MLDIPLEIPGRGLTWGWLLQRDGAGTTGGEVLIEALDGATLAGGVTALEQDDVALPGFLGPVLPFQQLDLQAAFDFLVFLTRHAFVIRIILTPGFNGGAIGPQEYWIILIGVIDDIPFGLGEIDDGKIILSGFSHEKDSTYT